MIPVLLKLSNFTSYGENPPELDFTRFKLAAISGPNGAGKSSLLDGITWCLWGTSRAGDSSDELVRLGTEKMFVEFSFQLDGNLYTIKRARSKKSDGNTALEIWSGSAKSPQTHNLTEGTIKASQQKIIDILHLTFDTFVNSSFIRQGHADEFTTKGPTERKKILADILGLGHYDKLEEKAKEKIKEIQTKLTLLEYQMLETEAELSQKEEREKQLTDAEFRVSSSETEIKILETEIKILQKERAVYELSLEQRRKLEENLIMQKGELKKIIERGKMRAERIKNLEENLKSLKGLSEEIEKLKETEKKLNELKTKLQEKLEIEKNLLTLKSNFSLKLQRIKTLEENVKERSHKLDDLKKEDAKCPTCGQEIDKERKLKVTARLEKDIQEFSFQIAKIGTSNEETEIKKIETSLSAFKVGADKFKQLEKDLLKLENLQRQKESLLQDSASLESEKKIVAEMRTLFKDKARQVKLLEEEFKKLPEIKEDKNILQQLTQKETILEKLKLEEKEARSLLGRATELISRSKQMEKFLDEQIEKKKVLSEEKAIYEELALAFGKKGIQAMIIENAIPEIEDATNRLLDKLTDGRMKVSLQTQKETKTLRLRSGQAGEKIPGIIETLDIIISDEMGERSYEMYSVDGNELVYICQNGQIKTLPIQQLWSNEVKVESQGKYQLQKTDFETLCYVKGKAKWQKVYKLLRHKSPNKMLQVKCGPGNYTVNLTKNHSIYTLTPDGLRVKRTEDLKEGDFLLSPRNIPENSASISNEIDLINYISQDFVEQRKINHKTLRWDNDLIWSRIDQRINRYIPLNNNLGKLMGIAVAEGSGQKAYTIAAGVDQKMAKEVISLAAQVFGTQERSLIFVPEEYMQKYVKIAPGISSTSPQAQYRPLIGGRLVAHIMKNIIGGKASLKRIPEFIFNASNKVKLSFLKGLIAGDGHTTYDPKKSKSEVCITTISKRLAGEIVFLCRQLGIWGRIEKHGDEGFRRGMNHQKSYRVVVSGKKNLEILGFGEIVSNRDGVTKYEGIPYALIGISRKDGKRFKRDSVDEIFNCGVDRVPKHAKENYLKVQGMVEDWNILEIKEVKEIEPSCEYVYDLVVPDNNSFVAGNGAILVHNSGGEAFRVNFALRLAISKLLTNRAGARLQFLVIDEGFGTQDAPGRGRLIEVIDTIKNDFEKILIITHIEELKEEFPVRVEVSKGATGSAFEIVGV